MFRYNKSILVALLLILISFFLVIDIADTLITSNQLAHNEYFTYKIFFILFSIFIAITVLIVVYLSKESQSNVLRKVVEYKLRIQHYLDSSAVGLLIIDESKKIVACNPHFSKITGYSTGQLYGNTLENFFKSNQVCQGGCDRLLQEVDAKGQASEQLNILRKDGKSVWLDVHATRFNVNKSSTNVVFSVNDITETIETQIKVRDLNAQLEERIDFFEKLIEVLPVPIYVQDASFRIIQTNELFSKLFGLSHDALMGKTFKDLIDHETARRFHEIDERLNEEKMQSYTEGLALNGRDLILECYKAAIYKDETFDGAIGAMIDVTQREAQERYLHERIKEELTRNEIQAKQHREELISDAKFKAIGQLAAGITHEINTPLTFIKGNFEMLRGDIEDAQNLSNKELMLQDCDSIHTGIERISNIVESMREISQKSDKNKDRINLYAALVSSLTMAHNRAKHIATIFLQGEPFELGMFKSKYSFYIEANAQRIEQVFIVIINNAMDELALIEGFENRKLDITIEEQAAHYVILLKDNAGGIQESVLPHLFDPFVTTKEHGGMGVGLNIAKSIMDDHDGTIEAYNDAEGAVFKVVFKKSEKVET